MIGFVLGTSDGRKILEKFNQYTDDIFISTVSGEGMNLYTEYKCKEANTKGLEIDGFVELIQKHNISLFVDASHPYAVNVSENVMKACKICKIPCVTYERPSIIKKYAKEPLVIEIKDYKELKDVLKNISGNILNTTGSRNIQNIVKLGLENRIIHRVLPTSKVLQEVEDIGISMEDIIALKMDPKMQSINETLIDLYTIKGMIAKDSGIAGGTDLKIETALKKGIPIFIIGRPKVEEVLTFYDIEKLYTYIIKKLQEKGR